MEQSNSMESGHSKEDLEAEDMPMTGGIFSPTNTPAAGKTKAKLAQEFNLCFYRYSSKHTTINVFAMLECKMRGHVVVVIGYIPWGQPSRYQVTAKNSHTKI